MRTHRVVIAAHVLCSLCAGARPGSSSPAALGSGTPRVGTDGGYDLESIAAVVLGGTALAGGRGGVAGTVGGVLVLAVLDSVFNQLEVDPFFKQVVRGVVIIAAVALYALRAPAIARRRHGDRGGMTDTTMTRRQGRRRPPPATSPTLAPAVVAARAWRSVARSAPIFVVLAVLLVWIAIENPTSSSRPASSPSSSGPRRSSCWPPASTS